MLARDTERMPSVGRYDDAIASPERNLRLFMTMFPRLGCAIQDMKYLDIRMTMGLSFIAGPTRLYSSSNGNVRIVVVNERAVIGK